VVLIKKKEAPEGWRGPFYELVEHDLFEALIMFFILLNTVAMAIQYDGIDPTLTNIF
jgi:hypothetical protein